MAEQTGTNPRNFNRVMISLLRSPLHRLMSKNIMLVTFKGRKSGRLFTTPVSYDWQDDIVTFMTRSGWWCNLNPAEEITLRIRGKDYRGQPVVITDRQPVADGLGIYVQHIPNVARFYNVKPDANGWVDPQELYRAAEGVAMVRVKLSG